MDGELNYSPFDRLVHRVAFAAPFVQLTAADIEHILYGSSYGHFRAARPIFITSLPRAGTTLVLEVLSQFPSLASHVYRDMPFVMAPVLWSRLSGPFRQAQTLRERAHGDGMEVGFDSPEAFEEILWRTFWPKKYSAQSIAPWRVGDASGEARSFFVAHMKKVISLRRPDRSDDGRYLSKNNANIARIDLIKRMFPDSQILMPVRRPIAHTRSLLRQHLRFLDMQKEEPFVGRYMADVGHYEFGGVHRPLGFDGGSELMHGMDPLTPNYWLAYWITAFEHVLARRERVVIVSYEGLCADPERGLGAICARFEIPDEGVVKTAAGLFRDPPANGVRDVDVDRGLLERAEQLYERLMADRLT